MRATDRWAIEERGISLLALMERAEGLARVVAEQQVPAGRIAIVCGKGNNGGDGLVAARLLREGVRDVAVLLRASRPRWPATLPNSCGGCWASRRGSIPARTRRRRGIVDAVLGTR